MCDEKYDEKQTWKEDAVKLDNVQTAIAYEAHKAYNLVMGVSEDIEEWAYVSTKKRGAFYLAAVAGLAEANRQKGAKGE